MTAVGHLLLFHWLALIKTTRQDASHSCHDDIMAWQLAAEGSRILAARPSNMHAGTASPPPRCRDLSPRCVCTFTGLKMRLRGGEWKKEQGKGWIWVGEVKPPESHQHRSSINKKSNRKMRRKAAKETLIQSTDQENQPPSNSSQGLNRADMFRNQFQAESDQPPSTHASVQSAAHEAPLEATTNPPAPLTKSQGAKSSWLPPADLDLPIPLPPSILQGPKVTHNKGSDGADQNVVSALKKLLKVTEPSPTCACPPFFTRIHVHMRNLSCNA
jgi:hypothetical protein